MIFPAVIQLLLAVPPAPILSPELAVRVALADADASNNQDAPFYRYLWIPYSGEEDAAAFFTALDLHVNLLSREATFYHPKSLGANLWRVDIREYKWRRETFENLANIDPYFHRRVEVVEVVEVVEHFDQEYGYQSPAGWVRTHSQREKRTVKKKVKKVKQDLFVPLGAAQLASLSLLTQSAVPIVRADWFLAESARQTDLHNLEQGAGYYDFLGGLRRQEDFFKLVGFDPAAAARAEVEVRAVVDPSGVTQQNRQVVRFGTATGGLWQTLEVIDQAGRGIAINHLRRGEFQVDASEFYGALPNGLPATFLANGQGVAQASVPDTIAHDDSPLNTSRDKRVHVNLACMRCHAGEILQPFADRVRAIYGPPRGTGTFDKRIDLELRRQYAVPIDRLLERDRAAYRDAFHGAVGLTPQKASELYAGAFSNYAYRRLGLAEVARELGVTGPQFAKAYKDAAFRLGRSDFRLDPLTVGDTIGRLTFEDAFIDAQDILFGVLRE